MVGNAVLPPPNTALFQFTVGEALAVVATAGPTEADLCSLNATLQVAHNMPGQIWPGRACANLAQAGMGEKKDGQRVYFALSI